MYYLNPLSKLKFNEFVKIRVLKFSHNFNIVTFNTTNVFTLNS